MLLYKNTKTGAVITVPCPVKGDWELIEPVEEKKEEPKKEVKKARKKK